MAESQKYYLGDTLINHQYLGNDAIISDLGDGQGPVLTDLYTWYDAGNLNSYPTSGSAWNDLQGNRNATLFGTYAYGSSPYGHIDFNGGIGDFGSISTLSLVGEFTIVIWFRLDGSGGTNTFLGGNESPSSGNQAKLALLNTGNPAFFRAEVNGTSTTLDIGYNAATMNGNWHQFGIKRDSSNNIYGILDNTTWVTGSATISDNFDIREIASSENSGQEFDGALSSILIYTSSLSDADVSQNYSYYSGKF